MKIVKRLVFAIAWYALLAAPAYAQLKNPLTVQSIADFVATALKILVMVALPVITLFIVYSGFMFITAQGNEEGLKTARRNFVYVVVGTLLILGAWIIATLIAGTVSQIAGNT